MPLLYAVVGDDLHLGINGALTKLSGMPMLTQWISKCINITDIYSPDSSVDLDISFHATNAEAGIDDIMLSAFPCIEGKILFP